MTDFSTLSDEQLVELCLEENSAAWSVLCARYSDVARKKVSAISVNAVDCDDLVQEGMIGLFSAVHSYDSQKKASFSTYANVCIRNSIYNALNSLRQRSVLSKEQFDFIESNDYVDTSMTPEELAISKSEVDFLHSLIAKNLSAKEREAFMLFLGGYTYSSIAKKLGTTEKAVDGALQRSRSKLRNVLRNNTLPDSLK